MTDHDNIEETALLDDGHRLSDGEGLAQAGLVESGTSRSGYVAGSGRARAVAGLTEVSPQAEELARWVVRLGGLQTDAPLGLLEDAAREALALIAQLADVAKTDDRAEQIESVMDCAEAFAVQNLRLRLEASVSQAKLEPPQPRVGYQDLMATARLRDLAQHQVDELRGELFGSAATPFATLAEAVAWIDEEHTRAGEHTNGELVQFLGAYRQIDIRLAQLQNRGSPFEDDFTYPLERYVTVRHGAGLRSWPVGKSVPLKILWYGLKGLARDLLVDEWQAADFVLLGVPPAVPRYSVIWRERYVTDSGLPPRESARATWVELEINDRFFSYKDIRDVYRELAQSGFLISHKSPAQLAKLERLRKFVEQRRPPGGWRGGALRAALPWRQVLAEWNAANPGARYCLSGIQRAYREARDYATGSATAASRRRRRAIDLPPPFC